MTETIDEMTFDQALDRVIGYLGDEADHFEECSPRERRDHIWLAVKVLMRHRNQARHLEWLRGPEGREWLASANLEELCSAQLPLVRHPELDPGHLVHDEIERFIRGPDGYDTDGVAFVKENAR
jgi:hypothetical protein